MEIFLIDAIGPFFRGYTKKRVNWSKIPFPHLYQATEEQWAEITAELRTFAAGAAAQGYNAVTLDDLAHLATHPAHEPEAAEIIAKLRPRFREFIRLLKNDFSLAVYLTSDVLPATPATEAAIGKSPRAAAAYYHDLVRRTLDDFPELEGIVMRIGESDGNDVEDIIRTRLHLRGAAETNRFLRELLPEFESRGKTLIFRTWTVGAHRIGDLIWHRDTLARTLVGISSENFIVSMKHGESDFFRFLPLNEAFSRVNCRKIIELQARREYEGAGEFPSFIGWDCERFAAELAAIPRMAGVSVWCQTGGWHRFRRRAFLDQNDIWIRLNTLAAIRVFRDGKSAADAVAEITGGGQQAAAAIELLALSDEAIRKLFYIGHFARQKWFFRRVRIPPLFHVYWDSLFVNHGVAMLIRQFVSDPENALAKGEEAARLFPEMIALAREAELPVADIEHMADFFRLLALARRYYFLPEEDGIHDEIFAAKKSYKERWPKTLRARYRVKVSFKEFPVARRTLALAARVLLRKQRGYRVIDRVFTLYLAGLAYRTLRPRDPKKMPKFLRKSAMGVDAVLR